MKSFLPLLVALFALSCATEKQFFIKSLSDTDKIYLNDNDSLIKKFTGKTNWHRQYWTGYLSIEKNVKSFDIKQIGEWRQTSKDGQELYTIADFDKFGYIVDERILGDEGMPPIGETHCIKDTVDGRIRLVCEVTNRYPNGQLKERGQRIIIKDKATKDGKWEYYLDTGTLDKTVNYINYKPVK